VLADLQLIAIGIGVGFMMSAPVGPVNILCIHRTLAHGFWGGLGAGLGAVLSDAFVALIAAAGITAISSAMVTYRSQLELFGGLIMIAFGLYMLLAARRDQDDSAGEDEERSFLWTIPQTFLLTITNPGAVLGLFTVFGSVGTITGIQNSMDALKLVAGIVIGGLMWWAVLSLLVALLRDRISTKSLAIFSWLAAIGLMLFGLALLGHVAWTELRPNVGS
jgi:threonine/homoserine/homoserine lactone efflux protein